MAEPFKERWYKINLKLLLHKHDSSRYRDVGCLCFWRERRGLKTRLTPTSVVFRSLVSPEKLVEKPWGHLWTMELIIPYALITWRSPLPHTNLISAPSLVIIFILLFILALVHLFIGEGDVKYVQGLVAKGTGGTCHPGKRMSDRNCRP